MWLALASIYRLLMGGSGFGLAIGLTVSGKTKFENLSPKLILFPLYPATSEDKNVPVSILRLGTWKCQNESIES